MFIHFNKIFVWRFLSFNFKCNYSTSRTLEKVERWLIIGDVFLLYLSKHGHNCFLTSIIHRRQYCLYVRQCFEMIHQFLSSLSLQRFGIDKGDIPDLAKAPSSLLEALEQHLASLEGRKLPVSNSGTSTSTSNSASRSGEKSTTVNGSSPVQLTASERQKIIEVRIESGVTYCNRGLFNLPTFLWIAESHVNQVIVMLFVWGISLLWKTRWLRAWVSSGALFRNICRSTFS